MNRLIAVRCARQVLFHNTPRLIPVRSRLVVSTTSSIHGQSIRFFSDNNNTYTKKEGEAADSADPTAAYSNDDNTIKPEQETVTQPPEDPRDAQIKDLKSQLLRSLADQENTRRIAQRDVDSAKKFAIKSFAKSLLETSDNLELALQAVPEELLATPSEHGAPSSSDEAKDLRRVLLALFEGIKLTETCLNKALESNGLLRYGKVGETFDPNLHDALFEYADPTKPAGTVGQVMKHGFMLNQRVLRPAEVGVIKKE